MLALLPEEAREEELLLEPALVRDHHQQRQQVERHGFLARLEERRQLQEHLPLQAGERQPVGAIAREVDVVGIPDAEALGLLVEPHRQRTTVEARRDRLKRRVSHASILRQARVYPVPVNLTTLDEQLKDQPAYRARQVWEWVAGGAKGYGEMTNLPAALRARLDAKVPFSTLEVEQEWLAKRRHAEGALPDARRSSRRGGADALPRRAPLHLRLVAVRLPLDVHVLRDRPDEVRPQPDRVGDPRPGAPLPADRAGQPPRLHGDGRADVQHRRGTGGRARVFRISGSRIGARRSRRSAGCPVCAGSWTRSTSRSASRCPSTRRTLRCEAG